MSDRKLSIIIVNFRSQNFLGKCITSVWEKIVPRLGTEIIIVNNDPAEDLERIRNKFPEIIFLNNEKNKGYGEACNLGADKAKGDIFLFLNPDTEIVSQNILEVISEFDADDIGAIGSCLLTEYGRAQEWSAGEEVGLIDILRNNLGLPRSKITWESPRAAECAWVSGTAMFIKKELFQKLSGFDEKFFMYFEDVDLCKRAKALGQKIIYFPAFKVNHRGGESYPDKKEQKENYYHSQNYYFKKHCGSVQTVLVKVLRRIFA